MSIIGFKNIKLFKRAQLGTAGRNGGPRQEPEKPASLPARVIGSPWTFMVLAAVVIALFHSYKPSGSLAQVKKGEIAARDIIAPFDLLIEEREATELRRDEAEAAVVPVYNYDPNVFANTEDKVRQMFSLGREWAQHNPASQDPEPLARLFREKLGLDLDRGDIAVLIRLKFPASLEDTLVAVLSKVFRNGVILSKSLLAHGEEEKGLVLVDLRERAIERKVRLDRLLDLRESETAASIELDQVELSQRARTALKNLASILITPNTTYNKIETDRRRALARGSVGTVTRTVKKGRVIVRKGDEVGEEAEKVIGLYNERLQRRSSWVPDFIGTLILYLLLLSALLYYLNFAYKKDLAENNFRMTGTLLVASLAVYKVFLALGGLIAASSSLFPLSDPGIYYYAIPFQVGSLVFASIAPDAMALVFVVFNSLAAGLLIGGDLNIMIFAFVGGLAAFYGVRRFRRRYRAAVLRTGFLFIPAASALFLISYHLIEGGFNPAATAVEILMGFFGGVIAGALAFLFLPVVENAFGFITASKLMELTDSELPILRQMSLEAPGSYHHSIVVATLAEKAAEELGLDARLVKAGAMYHDIGKLKMPEYFIENQERAEDLHKDLKPSMSTLVIINHVKEGLEMARKLKLPRPVREIIEQHHGNSLVRYFYFKAKQASDPEHEKVGEETYRYPGPPPRTKEAAIVLLADSVEAASRSLKLPSKANLKRVITDIFNTYLHDGQLDDCDISLRELRHVALSFLNTLFAIYHPRLKYQEFQFERRAAMNPAARQEETETETEPEAEEDAAADAREEAEPGKAPAPKTDEGKGDG